MSGQLPEPLVPADVDLRDYQFMPLDVVRLRDSKIVDEASGDEFRAAVLLWCSSWHQVPAASLPDDDVQLAKFAGYGRVVKEWLKVKAGALHGFIRCSDGRLYHPVVAEKAIEAWAGKRKASSAGKVGANARWGKKDADANANATKTDATAIAKDATAISGDGNRIKNAPVLDGNREGQGEDREKERKPEAHSTASARAPVEELCAALGVELTADLSRINWPAELHKWSENGGSLEDLLAAAKRERERGNSAKPLRWYLKCSEDFRAERLAKQAQAGQAAYHERMQWLDRYGFDGKWISAEHDAVLGVGPPPHEAGTLVTDDDLDRVKGARNMRDKLRERAAA